MATFLATRDLHGRLIPIDDLGRSAVQKLPQDATVMIELRRPRNVHHHRKFFALLNLVFENQSRYPTLDDLLDAIKVHTGHAKEMTLKDGRVVFIPKSIAFHNMDQTAFEQFYDAVITVVCTTILPGLPEGTLRNEIEELVA